MELVSHSLFDGCTDRSLYAYALAEQAGSHQVQLRLATHIFNPRPG